MRFCHLFIVLLDFISLEYPLYCIFALCKIQSTVVQNLQEYIKQVLKTCSNTTDYCGKNYVTDLAEESAEDRFPCLTPPGPGKRKEYFSLRGKNISHKELARIVVCRDFFSFFLFLSKMFSTPACPLCKLNQNTFQLPRLLQISSCTATGAYSKCLHYWVPCKIQGG